MFFSISSFSRYGCFLATGGGGGGIGQFYHSKVVTKRGKVLYWFVKNVLGVLSKWDQFILNFCNQMQNFDVLTCKFLWFYFYFHYDYVTRMRGQFGNNITCICIG